MKNTRGSVRFRHAQRKTLGLSGCGGSDGKASFGGRIMWDLGCVGASVFFFVIAIGYTTGCERLGMKEKQG
ncbi:hypothetical protein [Tunturiibacter gelidoferens]|uniref:Uncharacterized protein n=1 Tax=Tunturiibacter lichenicola TaxID=2051959 RepID=A0A7Y9T0T4_9BACT|nr:hypothetical protein [Edaphobacter lichenicola]NYF49648.1 hypothetical protein [Edaphobacter lichenicola]